MPTKHLSIQPTPGGVPLNISSMRPSSAGPAAVANPTHHNNVTIAPNPSSISRNSKKSGGSGIVIRTSKHWVLPPRPKPGRKPSASTGGSSKHGCNSNNSGNGSGSGSGSGSSSRSRSNPTVPSAVTSPVPTANETKKGEKTRLSKRAPVPAEVPQLSKPVSAIPLTSSSTTAISKPSITPITSKPASTQKTNTKSAIAMTKTASVTTPEVTSVAKNNKKTSTRKPNKTTLKKEIQQLKFENCKLKQELGQLVGSLQELKKKCSLCDDSHAVYNEYAENASTRKRSFADILDLQEPDNTTDAFLKFEEDDEETAVSASVPIANVHSVNMMMTPSFASQYSSRTNLTDDEDLGFSSSTPSSLFSSELQQSMTNTSSVSMAINNSMNHQTTQSKTVTGVPVHSPQHHHGSSPSSSTSSKQQGVGACSNTAIQFLDDYEQMDFYNKHHGLLEQEKNNENESSLQQIFDTNLDSQTASTGGDLHLDVIKEEDLDFKFDHDFDEDDTGILNFLQNHVSLDGVKNENNSVPIKAEEDNDDALISRQGTQPFDELFNTTKDENDSGDYLPPSLEELMEEQDGINQNSKLIDSQDNNDVDMMKMEVFKFA